MKEEELSDRQQTEFNMSISYLNRLNEWFYIVGQSHLSLNSFSWFHTLTLLFAELSTEMKEEEINRWKEKLPSINEKVLQNQEKITNTKRVEIPKDLYFELLDYELFIRGVLKTSGLQMKMKEVKLPAAKGE